MEEKRGLSAVVSRLSVREKRLLVFWVVGMAIIVVFLVGYFATTKIGAKKEAAVSYQETLDVIRTKQGAYLARKGESPDKLSDKIANNKIKLQTFLDGEAGKFSLRIKNFKESSVPLGGKRRKDKKNTGPSIMEETVAIDIEETEYSNVVGFMDAINATKELVVIKRVKVSRPRRGINSTKVRVSMTVSTFKLGGS